MPRRSTSADTEQAEPRALHINMSVPFRGQIQTALAPPEPRASATAPTHSGEASHDASGYRSDNQDRSHDTQQITMTTGSPPMYPALHTTPQPSLGEQYAREDDSPMQRTPSYTESGPPPPLSRNTAPAGGYDMFAPPTSTHPTWQALHDYAQSHASEHGYALSINTTAKNRSRIKLACVCYGQPKNTHKLTPETRIRKNRLSYKTGCKMWVEGKKQDDGTWLLRVGEGQHNHEGRASEGWAVQRKRTWGVVGGRIGVGGVTATEEARRESLGPNDAEGPTDERPDEIQLRPMAIHRLERGGIIWKIVEQEMLRSEPLHGRDRGVGRTVDVLQTRLPGIHIFKRDVYNIRAQIKRARKAAGQQVGEGMNDSELDDDERADDARAVAAAAAATEQQHLSVAPTVPLHPRTLPRLHILPPTRPVPPSHIDPLLTASPAQSTVAPPQPASAHACAAELELEQLRAENAQLQRLLHDKTDEVKKKTIEIASLRSQVDYMHMMGISGRSSRLGLAE